MRALIALWAAFFAEGAVSVASLKQGYACCEAYGWIVQQGTVEAKYEMQTFISKNEDVVRQACADIQKAWLREKAEKARAANPKEVQYTQMSAADETLHESGSQTVPYCPAPQSPKRPRNE